MLIEVSADVGFDFGQRLAAQLLDQLTAVLVANLLEFLLLVRIEWGAILLSRSSAICFNCSSRPSGFEEVFFFSSFSFGSSCWMTGKICCRCSC